MRLDQHIVKLWRTLLIEYAAIFWTAFALGCAVTGNK